MKMEYINKLEKTQIKKYKLWQVCKFDRRFNGIPKEKQENITNFKHVSAKKLKEYELKESGKVRLLSTGNYVGYTKYDKNDKNINFGEVITIPTGGTANIKYHKGYFIDSGNILISSDLLNLKYLYYFLTNNNDKIQSFYRGAGVQHPSMSDIIEMEIISPPMEVQNEIVEVLDKFSALEAELEAELEARTKQYDYYRSKLLDFKDENVVWIEISKVFNLRNGYTPSTKNDENWSNGNIPWFRMEDLRAKGTLLSDSIKKITHKAVKGKLFKANSIIISTSATIGEYALVTVDYMSNQRFTNLEVKDKFKEKVNIKFVKYYMSVISEWSKKNIRESSFASVDMDRFRKLKFPIPPLDKQERIVSILNKFSALVTDIKEGLPAEIELRRKQYEYYRNKLLTFDKE